ncbi:hypothetical protein AB0H31_24580 [Amycolatopsis japonica]
MALTVSQPSTVAGFVDSALDAGATSLQPVAKSLWGCGGVVRAPDGTIWKVATSVEKDSGRVYVEFAARTSPVKLALYRRRALAKDVGVSPEGTGSHDSRSSALTSLCVCTRNNRRKT